MAKKSKPLLERSFTRAAIVGLAVLVFGFLLAVRVAELEASSVKIALEALSSVLLSLGAVTLIYDVFQRRAIMRDLLDAVQLEGRLAQTGIQGIYLENDFSWSEVLDTSSWFRVLLVDPSLWAEREWTRVLGAGQERAIDIEVYIPNPLSGAFDEIASQLGFETDEFEKRLARAQRILEDRWQNATENIRKGSSFSIRYYNGACRYSIVATDQHCVVVLPAAFVGNADDAGAGVHFALAATEFPVRWFRDQLSGLSEQDLPQGFSDEVT